MIAVATSRRIQIKNIIFATDFSHAAAIALPFAAEIAQHFGAKLFAVHAKTPENYALPPVEIWPAINAEVENQTHLLEETLHHDFPTVESEVLIAEGGVWGVIDALAKEKYADLIVLGTHGRRGIDKFLLGSVAEEILRRATCPVLTVGPNSATERPPGAKLQRIVYATDFGICSHTAAAYAVSLAQEYNAHLTLLHVIDTPKRGDLVTPVELEGAALEHLRALIMGEGELWCQPRFVVRQGAPADKILELAEQDSADLIVLGLRDFTGVIRATHGSTAVAHQVLARATCPVLTLRG
jgi:nucleotide-binding universal stress UspA family protein